MSARGSDALQDTQDGAGEDDQPAGESQELLGQPLPNTLDFMMESIEQELPEIPLPGPEQPQVPSPPKDKAVEQDFALPPAAEPLVEKEVANVGGESTKVVPTPCRANSISQLVPEAGTTEATEARA